MTKDNTNEFPKSPKSKFSCPVSPQVLWFHGLIFKECPLCPEERDMKDYCPNCPLRGEVKFDQKDKQKYSKNNKNRDKKDPSNIEKRNKDPIPNIGKTYSTD